MSKELVPVEEAPGPTDVQLKQIVQTARRQFALEKKIARIEEHLEELKTELQGLQERELPDLMLEAGTTLIGLSSQAQIELITQVNARWPKDPNARQKAIAYLEANKAKALIKRELSIGFGKDQAKPMEMVLNYIRRRKFANSLSIEQNVTVHSQTLSAWVRERKADGYEVPNEILGVHERRYTKITVKEKKKKGDL